MASHLRSLQKTYDGTWKEVKPHTEVLSPDSHVYLTILPTEMEDRAEQERLEQVFEEFFHEVDQMEFTPPATPLSPATNAVVEKLLAKRLWWSLFSGMTAIDTNLNHDHRAK